MHQHGPSGSALLAVLLLPLGLALSACQSDTDKFNDAVLRTIVDEGRTNELAEFLGSGGSANRSLTLRKHVPVREPLLHIAVRAGRICMAEMLVAHGAEVQGKDWEGNTPLMAAMNSDLAEEQRLNVVRWLSDHGADVHTRNRNGYGALHLAVSLENPLKTVEFLISHGAAVNSTNSVGQTALHLCSDPETAALLISSGANPNQRDADGHTPLDQAVFHKKNEMIKMLRGSMKGVTH